MIKYLIAIFIMCFSAVAFAQDKTVFIEGIIIAPAGEDVEGISIYNTATKKGTITNATGHFNITAALNDRLVVTAIQFGERFFMIDEDAIKTKRLVFYLNPSVQVLDEILIRSHDLTGNLDLDAVNIKTYALGIGAMGPWNVGNGLPDMPDSQSSLKQNVALEVLGATTPSQANLTPLFKPLYDALFRKRVKRADYPSETVAEKLYNLMEKGFFMEVLQLKEDEISGFLIFVEEKGIPESLLNNRNTLRLMDHLVDLTSEYRALARVE